MQLDGARILITGGSSGIGKATAKLLGVSGARVLITGRDEQKVLASARETGSIGIRADVSRPDDITTTFDAVRSELGGLDVLINNAGIGIFPKITEAKWEEFEEVFRTNVFGAAMMAKEAANAFIQQQTPGTIINIGSTASLKGFERGSVYSASKFALRSLTECWQAELRKQNIRVMQVNPSEVATAFANPDRIERSAAPNKLRSEEIAHAIKSILEMDSRGMIPELSVWATNPWS